MGSGARHGQSAQSEQAGRGYGLLVAATPPGRHPAVAATEALPGLAATPPSVLLGTGTGSVVQLPDPGDPNTVLSHLRTAAANDGPLLVYLAGQLMLDSREHVPHMALSRSTQRSVRYTGLPWHWLAAELGRRPFGPTTVIADLVADEAMWRERAQHPLGGGGLVLYGVLAAPPARRGMRVPDYSRALAGVLRASRVRPQLDELHQLALHRAGFGSGAAAEERMLLGGGGSGDGGGGDGIAGGAAGFGGTGGFGSTAGTGSGPWSVPGPPWAPAPSGASGVPGPVVAGAAGTGGTGVPEAPPVPPVPAPVPATAHAPAAGHAPAAAPVPTAGAAPPVHTPAAGAGTGTIGTGPGTATTGTGTGAGAAAVPGAATFTTDATEPASRPAPPLPQMPPSPPPGPHSVSGAPAGPQQAPANTPAPGAIPSGVHEAIYRAADEGRHSEAAIMAAQWETAALRASGPHSREAVHWVEVRADLAHRAGEPARACTLWLQAASVRLQSGQDPEDAEVFGAVDRAHHCWHQVAHPAQAHPLGVRLAELRERAPGLRPGAVRDVQDRLALLARGHGRGDQQAAG